jgi:putative aminopeptidase FrvX
VLAPITIDVESMVCFLVDLLNVPSPTGDAGRAIALVQERFGALPVTQRVTTKGALVCTWEGSQADAPRGLTAHVDTLGAVVQQIKDNGRLQLVQLGSWSWTSVEGEGVTVFTRDGRTVRGAFLPVMASSHAYRAEERDGHKRDRKDMEVRLDVRTASRPETEALGIRVGDFVAFDPRVEVLESGFIRSRHLDDKASVACIYGALAALAGAELQPRQRTTIHISNYEEVGHGAAAGLPDELVELVAVDMAVVAPDQQSDEFSVTICAKDGGGPYDVTLRRQLEALARDQGLAHCTDVYLYYQSDGEAYWSAGGDVRVALIGPGVDASHHYERTHRDALENTARLIAAYLLS